ncbi:MAG: tRNA (guanosine(46)-N7)-methyltransferase TrmB [Lachnospiraceae bacterium]
MRLRNVTGSREVIAACDYVIHNERECRGKWKEIFGNDHPIRIEIGMGKGRFIMDLARQNPDINYIGIEKYSSVLIRGIQKLEADPLPNLYFIRMEAEEITTVFAEGEVDRIYLNFSDPWPKDRHAKRRLPSREFLRRYDEILIPDGVIEFKTDNHDLFQFALEELEPAGWKILQMTEDLHHNAKMMEGNVMTEYEERFSSKGNPICKYVIAREKCQRTEAVKECSI